MKESVTCDYQVSDNCKKTYMISRRCINRTKKDNHGKIICMYCSRQIKYLGRNNPNCKYINLDDNFFNNIDSEGKAYLLGWIASDGHVSKNNGIIIKINDIDIEILRVLRDIISLDLPIIRDKKRLMSSLGFYSYSISKDICKLLNIKPGKKSDIVEFPLLNESLSWAFLRGYFDGDGCISLKQNIPKCSISSKSKKMLEAIKNISNSKCSIYNNIIEWSGTNAVDFLSKLYDNSKYSLNRKIDKYYDICLYKPSLSGAGYKCDKFRWGKTRADAIAPYKKRASDSGYDLTLLEKIKEIGDLEYYSTGIKIKPIHGIYFDLVPRSSTPITGRILANCTGIIDASYLGEIIVCLKKLDSSKEDLTLPGRYVQIIPRQAIHVEFVEVDSFEETNRGENGFGSTGR